MLNIPRRTVKEAYERVNGDDKIVARTLRKLEMEFKRKPKLAFDKWKSMVGNSKVTDVESQLKAHKL